MPRRAAHSPALDFPPLAWTPTVFGTDQLNRVGRRAQAWRRVSQTRPGPTARTSDRPAHPGARGRGRPREPATARHTPGCARPGPVVRTPQRWHTGRCARPGPTARTSDRPAHPGIREAEADRANKRPPGTPRDTRGRGRPRGAPREGRARPGRCSWARCVNTTPEFAPGLALGPRPRVGTRPRGVIAVRRASTPMPASARPRRPGIGRPPASRALRACRSGRRGRSRRGRRSGRLP